MAFDLRSSLHFAAEMPRLSALVAERIGLHFPPARFADLARGLTAAAVELGFDDVAEYADSLLTSPVTPQQVQVLATHLTIGETHFFREPATWAALRTEVLPQIIRARTGRDQRLRFWSTACASGEEAYSLAMLVDELLPDRTNWHVTILGTDINPRALRTAATGVYGNWSFRGVSTDVKARYFTPAADGRLAIHEPMRRLVTFEHLNLVEDLYPSVTTGTNAMDVILCRNVLLYFMPRQITKVVTKLHATLVDGGWLAVSPSEASATHFPQFRVANASGAILFRKGLPQRPAQIAAAAPQWRTPHVAPKREDIPGRARALANEGRLAEALSLCERWIAYDSLSAPAHYIRGMILGEHGDAAAARRSLQRTLYLDPAFVLAHVALGTLARAGGQHHAAARHFRNARQLLEGLAPDAVLPESGGLTAERLAQTLAALSDSENRL